MAATVQIRQDYGGTDNSPATTDEAVTNLRYKEADNNTQDLNNPVTIPGAGTKYSYWKHCFLEVTAAGGFTQIDNVKIWVTSFDWTGVTLEMGGQYPIHGTASTAGYDVADGLDVLTVHTDITTVQDLGAANSSGTALGPITINDNAGGPIVAVNQSTNYFVTNIEVGTTAVAGTQTSKQVNVEYDEI
jgi:hypothetical protein